MRNSIINAAEIASYDQFKQVALQDFGMRDALHTQLGCAFGAGFVASIVGSPVCVLKTRIMNLKAGQSTFQMIHTMVSNEGLGAFYKGYTA